MGCAHPRRQTYAIPINTDNKPEGESHTYRCPSAKENLTTTFKDDNKVRTIKDVYLRSFEKFADQPFLGMRKRESKNMLAHYEFKTYAEVRKIAEQVGSGIKNLDLAPVIKDADLHLSFIGIWSKNCSEWIELDIACSFYKHVSIPIYETLGPEVVGFILKQTKLTTIFCSGDHIDELLDGAREKGYKSLANIVTFGEEFSKNQKSKASEVKINLLTWKEVIKNGDDNMQKPVDVRPEDLYTICYTSGTTGTPKGAMLSHRSQTSTIAAIHEREDIIIDENDAYFSYLPLAHCMERSGILYMTSKGTSIGFSSGDNKRMKEDLQELKPTIFFGVPKVYNRIYEGVQKEISKQGPAVSALAKLAVQTKLFNLKTRGKYTHPIYDRIVFNKIKEAMGGRLRYCATGAAPIDPKVLNFLRVAWSCPVLEGYGPTEGCAVTFLSSPSDTQERQVGGPMGCLEYKVVDEKEMKYTSDDKDEHGRHVVRGEVCFRGPCAFNGYFKQPEKTKENLDKDGWVHTGDIGQINPDGTLSIIDKKKSFFKLSQGEYVAGDKVEEVYNKSDIVEEMFVYGNSNNDYIIAVVVPKKDKVKEMAKEMNIDGSYEEQLKNKELRQKVLAEMNKIAKSESLNGFEMARQILLLPKTFQEMNFMTPTAKLKRNEAKEKLQDEIDQMYKDGPLEK